MDEAVNAVSGQLGRNMSLALHEGDEAYLYEIGDRVLKHTGDYQAEGTVVGYAVTKANKLRYVVEHDVGMLHIYSGSNLRPV